MGPWASGYGHSASCLSLNSEHTLSLLDSHTRAGSSHAHALRPVRAVCEPLPEPLTSDGVRTSVADDAATMTVWPALRCLAKDHATHNHDIATRITASARTRCLARQHRDELLLVPACDAVGPMLSRQFQR